MKVNDDNFKFLLLFIFISILLSTLLFHLLSIISLSILLYFKFFSIFFFFSSNFFPSFSSWIPEEFLSSEVAMSTRSACCSSRSRKTKPENKKIIILNFLNLKQQKVILSNSKLVSSTAQRPATVLKHLIVCSDDQTSPLIFSFKLNYHFT